MEQLNRYKVEIIKNEDELNIILSGVGIIPSRLKFRAWHISDKIMRDVYSISPVCRHVALEMGELVVKDAGFDDVVLMQCSGRRDKHDRLIFEGDIVKVVKHGLSHVATVVYLPHCYCWYLKWGNDYNYGDFVADYVTLEIIGNVFENSELVEGENEI